MNAAGAVRFSTRGMTDDRRIELWEHHNERALVGLNARTAGGRPLEAAEVSILKGVFLLASVAQEAGIEEEFAAVPHALRALERGLETDPGALDGLGLMMLGRLKIALPVFSGGNVDAARFAALIAEHS